MDITPTSTQLTTPTATPEHTAATTPARDGVKFAQALGGAVTVAGQMAAKVSGAGGLGAGPIAAIGGSSTSSSLNGATDASGGDSSSQLQDLLQQQEQIQLESEQFTSLTNISKTEHDTKMSTIQNLRGS